ncbi:IclR family transcriptional regulator [Phenylobacterium sp. VNQ135]
MDTTVAKGMAVLELLAKADGPLRLSAIAEQLDLQKSNVHRLLGTLSTLGYVTQEAETGRYQPSLKLWELGVGIISAHPAKRAAAPFMQDLHRSTSETVSLTVLDGDEVLYLDKLLSPRPLRFTTQPGTRAPAALTASGRAMLALTEDPRPVLERSVKRWSKAKDLDVDAVMAELERIRRDGYATSESSWTPGIVSVAVAIPTRGGSAALTVSGPAERISEEKRQEIIEAVLHTGARIAETVGRL